jgi:hypothetical protein
VRSEKYTKNTKVKHRTTKRKNSEKLRVRRIKNQRRGTEESEYHRGKCWNHGIATDKHRIKKKIDNKK